MEPRTLEEMHARFRASSARINGAGAIREAWVRTEAELRERITQLQDQIAAADAENADLVERLKVASTAQTVIPPAPNKVDGFVGLLSEITGFSRAHVKSDRREISVVKARCIVYWLSKQFGELSLPMIGRRLGGKDHTTVLHGIRRVERVVDKLALKASPETPEAWAELLWGSKWPKHNEAVPSSPSASLRRA